MDNIFDYLDNYGSSSFREVPLNNVDLAIFSSISYVDFGGIIDQGHTKISLGDAAELYFMSHNKKDIKQNIMGVLGGIKILKEIMNLRRYRFLKLYNYEYICKSNEQFSAMFIDIDHHKSVVVFEGTDETVSGWFEDCELAYKFPVASHVDANNYVNKHIHFVSHRKYIFTGHSKGGNTALVAGMYLNRYKQFRLKKIVSLDGPGLRSKEKNSKLYKRINKKYNLIVPDHSLVGMILNNKDIPIVVKSTKKGLTAHHLHTWMITDTDFTKSELSNYSKKIKKVIDGFIAKYSDIELEEFVKNLFQVFECAEVDTLVDIKIAKIKKIFACLKATKTINEDSRAMISEFLTSLVNVIFEKNE